jgi:hypothetical protein
LSYQGIQAIIDLTLVYGPVKHFIISGGEPTLHLSKVVQLLQGTKAQCTKVLSNGWWMQSGKHKNKVLDAFQDCGLKILQISCGVEHQKFIPITKVIEGIHEALSQNRVQEVIVSYELKHTSQKYDVFRYFKELSLNYPKRFRVVLGFWNELDEQKEVRQDGRQVFDENHSDWCEALDAPVVSIFHDGTIYRCCGGLIMRDQYLYNMGNIFKDFSLPFLESDIFSDVFKTVQCSARMTDFEKAGASSGYAALFKCERCRVMTKEKLYQLRGDKNFGMDKQGALHA